MIALTLDGISKSYRLYGKPLDRLKEALFRKPYHQNFHALQDISLSISKGETLGIVGDNGAGKSTLLKILAGTLQPSSGELRISGRISALLELGSGFHEEFTGRQNIWMNASLMGLTKYEIEAWEDEIISFSELHDFIDRPIKTYSSGMVVRLAFSIATVVDPDILIIDEALSVGDQYFQKKCIDKMMEIKARNKIILFCSHSLYLVNMMCDRAVWIDKGEMVDVGSAEAVTANYENFCRQKTVPSASSDQVSPNQEISSDISTRTGGQGNPAPYHDAEEKFKEHQDGQENREERDPPVIEDAPVLSRVKIQSVLLNGVAEDIELNTGDRLEIDIFYESHGDMPFCVALILKRNDQLMCHASKMRTSIPQPLRGKGPGHVRFTYPAIPLYHGQFFAEVLISDDLEMMLYDQALSSNMTVRPGKGSPNEMGLVKMDHSWQIQSLPNNGHVRPPDTTKNENPIIRNGRDFHINKGRQS